MFQRLKDRPAPIQPMSQGVAPTTPIIRKKETDVGHNNLEIQDWEEESSNPASNFVPMHPYYTTEKRVEHREYSAEKKLRYENSPCIEDMLQIRKQYLKNKEKQDALEAEKAKKRARQAAKMKELEDAIRTGKVEDLDLDLDADEEDVVVDMDDTDPDSEEFKAIALFMKEKKLTTTRNSALMHRKLSRYRHFRVSWRAYWTNGRRFDPCTEVLPWMYIGRGNLAKDSRFLEAMGFTHIMNCTKEMPNHHSGKFIYQRIPIDDSENCDAGARFQKAIDFIKRVAHAKGKIYIHCTVGASRAPTMAMAYFIQVRKIALLDIFKYLQAIRTVVEPNHHFLFQLAELEIRQGLGSSVFYHKLWRAYEYNNIRGEITFLRETEGVYSTAWRIHSAENAMLDFKDDMEAELERRALANK